MARTWSIALALVFALTACGAKAASGPAWPKSQDPEKDGGESLEPREPSAIAVADDEDEDEDEDDKPVAAAKIDKAETPAPTPTAPTPAPPVLDDPTFTEEIIIEIGDD